MTIMDNLKKVEEAVKTNTATGGNFGFLLKSAAINALTRGINTPQWDSYMSLFADNAQQLNRLTVEDPDEPTYLRESRAYIVSNAICGADTTGQTGANVNPDVDTGLSVAGDGTINKPFEIPITNI